MPRGLSIVFTGQHHHNLCYGCRTGIKRGDVHSWVDGKASKWWQSVRCGEFVTGKKQIAIVKSFRLISTVCVESVANQSRCLQSDCIKAMRSDRTDQIGCNNSITVTWAVLVVDTGLWCGDYWYNSTHFLIGSCPQKNWMGRVKEYERPINNSGKSAIKIEPRENSLHQSGEWVWDGLSHFPRSGLYH